MGAGLRFLAQDLDRARPRGQVQLGKVGLADRQRQLAALDDLGDIRQGLWIAGKAFYKLRSGQEKSFGWSRVRLGQLIQRAVEADGCGRALQPGLGGFQVIDGMRGHAGQAQFTGQVHQLVHPQTIHGRLVQLQLCV